MQCNKQFWKRIKKLLKTNKRKTEQSVIQWLLFISLSDFYNEYILCCSSYEGLFDSRHKNYPWVCWFWNCLKTRNLYETEIKTQYQTFTRSLYWLSVTFENGNVVHLKCYWHCDINRTILLKCNAFMYFSTKNMMN